MSTEPPRNRDRVPPTTPADSAPRTQPAATRPVQQPAAAAPAPRRRGFWEQVRLGLLVATGILLLLFIILNYEEVKVRLLFWNPELRLAWALLIAAFLGFVAGWLVPKLPSRRR